MSLSSLLFLATSFGLNLSAGFTPGFLEFNDSSLLDIVEVVDLAD